MPTWLQRCSLPLYRWNILTFFIYWYESKTSYTSKQFHNTNFISHLVFRLFLHLLFERQKHQENILQRLPHQHKLVTLQRQAHLHQTVTHQWQAHRQRPNHQHQRVTRQRPAHLQQTVTRQRQENEVNVVEWIIFKSSFCCFYRLNLLLIVLLL